MKVILENELASQQFATKLARVLLPDLPNTHAVIFLKGDLGAGKTFFTRAFLQACGIKGRIKSPTYALSEPYYIDDLTLSHFDFYRFDSEDEWLEAGFQDDIAASNLSLIEWPEKAGHRLPKPDLEIHFEYLNQGRLLTLSTQTQQGATWLKAMI
ncbi:tRNA (adenosine(37)-N6)-threonylcarbamoyltransferase complex ATPase subunit type 1 TsaE [Basilea psittacipulmonis]|uniref:tRNA threonylcarbamoyladenosine biosynthesis protein TsaE n=1 Tax=Basilea psittacipulmonis DSM 24701 TaxID=1072685 RepID=A0A077DIJ3_9BURK|nr:tRNA (adenosine(37)-N6)-threonylcarbamoyltransferase complex ATPase subunit type 1 TsaE [Basilea psittacipulmonis]AIL32993.1 hypothetical protein IX83_06405 [Basilea psittacipulmonis DSM 24701]